MAKKKYWISQLDPNLIVAVGVLIASFAALFVYVRQASIMTEQTKILLEQTKASIWPHVSIELSRSYNKGGLDYLQLMVSNKGTGPAIVEQSKISVDGKYIESWGDFYRTINLPDSLGATYSNQNISGRVLASNEKIKLIKWQRENKEAKQFELIDFIGKQLEKIKIEVCYKSIHGDTWHVSRTGFKTDLELNERSVVGQCDAGDGKLFLQ